jgi:site-specific recombinase XerC
MASRHKLIRSIKQLVGANKQGSFQTQNKREIELIQMAKDLTKGGYKLKHVSGLKPKHIEYLNQQWEARGLSAGTIKNKNTQLRWWTKLINKPSIMKSNDELGLARRTYIPTHSKAIDLNTIDFSKINDPHVEASLRLQYHLGLRREESIKIRPHLADKGDFIALEGSWCKGGRPRVIPILTQEARDAVDFAKSITNTQQDSLIPSHKNYRAQMHYYQYKTREANIKNPHGLRHAYAQRRYKELTGWDCPLQGGLSIKELTPDQRRKDYEVRLQISENLGHSRASVLTNYIGR